MADLEKEINLRFEFTDAVGDKVAHVLRYPTAHELKEYQRDISHNTRIRGGRVTGTLIPAQIGLYKTLVLRVEGFTKGEADLMEDPKWKDIIAEKRQTQCVNCIVRLMEREEVNEDDPFGKNTPET